MLLVKFANLEEDSFRLPKDVVEYCSSGYHQFWNSAGLWSSPREFLKDEESVGLLDFYDEAMAGVEEKLSALNMAFVRADALYALALIHYSREGKYVAYRRRKSVWMPNINFWPYLQSLKMEILVAYDIVRAGYIDDKLFGCQVRDIIVGGRHYDKVVHDVPGGEKDYTDQAGVLHISGGMEDYKYIWQAHLEELMTQLTEVAYDAVEMEPRLEETSCAYYEFGREEPMGRRDRYVCATKCLPFTDQKWPHFLYFKKVEGNRVIATVGPCAGKYPELCEAEAAIVEHWDGSCEEAFCIVVDSFEINRLSDIAGKIIWGFHDNGSALTLYSDTLAGKRLAGFTKGCTLIADYFEFVELYPLTNFDMQKLMDSEWGKLYGPRLITEKAKWLAERKKSTSIKSAEESNVFKDEVAAATQIDPYGISI